MDTNDDNERPAFEPDDSLGVQFQLTRWLSGDRAPAAEVRVHRLAVFEAGSLGKDPELRKADDEHRRIASLADDRPDVEDVSPAYPGFDQLKSTLRAGGLGLLHFAGHCDE